MLVIFFSCATCRADQNDDLFRKYVDAVCTYDFPEKSDVTWVTPEIREIIIRKAREAVKNPNSSNNFGAGRVLIELGDQPYIEAFVAEQRQHHAPLTESITMLPYLADDLYHGDTIKNVASDFSLPSTIDVSTRSMYRIIEKYPSFPAEARAWSRKQSQITSLNGPEGAANRLMRAWWEHNRDAVTTHQYSKAAWLPDAKLEKTARDADEKRIEFALAHNNLGAAPGHPLEKAKTQPPPPQNRMETPTAPYAVPVSMLPEQKGSTWLWIGSAIAVIFTSLLLWRRKEK